MRPWLRTLALFVACHGAAFAAGAWCAQQPPPIATALAPDGRRGFGLELSQREVSRLWRSKAAQDKEFLDGLTQLCVSTRVALLNLRSHYAERGYFKFLPTSAGEDLAALYGAYTKCYEAPARQLAAGDEKSVALAAMLIDTRFNVRRELVAGAEFALRDLERARAVLGATVTGYTSLLASEMESVAARADLAAAELRAFRSDLEALAPGTADEADSKADLDLRRELLELGRLPDDGRRAAAIWSALVPRHELERRMLPLLSSTRLEPQLRSLRDWRFRALAAAAERRTHVLEMLPDTTEGRAPPPEIARLGKSQRFRLAADMAIEALVGDPLEPELAWAAGHARGFFAPGRDEVIYMDRFLALSGLRYGEEPSPGRELTPREQEALEAVRRSGYK